MRRVLYTMISTICLATLVLLAIGLSYTPYSGTVTYAPHPATATPTYPVCVTEDGAGQALCMWQGMVSGDCAIAVMGDTYTSNLCATLHATGQTWTNPDGSSATQYGPDMVGECVSIMQDGRMDTEAQTILDNEGWTITDCIRAQLGE